jgi:hypothetical protein
MARRLLHNRLRLLFFTALVAMAYFPLTYYWADRFCISNIYSSIPLSYDEPTPSSEVLAALTQPYHYLASGSQTYAFESQDRHYVLKFFKHQRYRISSWLTALPLPHHLQAIYVAKQQKKEEKLQAHVQSCILAIEELPDETALLCLHLNKERLFNKKITLYDKLHRKVVISLDEYDFQLQRKTATVPATKEGFEAILTLLEKVFEKGIAQTDCALSKNVGYLNKQAIFIDTGSFSKDSRLKNTAYRLAQIEKATSKYK